MAIVVLIVGGLLSILGIAGYIYGLDLMPTERGVAGVISSAVVIVGGVLTLAIGLVLRKLENFGKALGLSELAALPPVAAPPAAQAEPAPVPDGPIELPTIVPVQPPLAQDAARQAARDAPPVAIEAPRRKPEVPAAPVSKFDLPRPVLPTAAAAGGAVAGAVAARTGLDAVEKALSFENLPLDDSRQDDPKHEDPKRENRQQEDRIPDPARSSLSQEPAIAPLNLPKLSPRSPAPATAKAPLRAHEVEYPVEVLKPAEPDARPEPAIPTPVTPVPEAADGPEPPLPDYAEVPMPAPETPAPAKTAVDAFEAELERLVPLRPVLPAAPPMPEIAPLEIKAPVAKAAETGTKHTGLEETGAETAGPETGKPDVAKPDVAKPDVARSETAKPQTARPAATGGERRRGAEKVEPPPAAPEAAAAPAAEPAAPAIAPASSEPTKPETTKPEAAKPEPAKPEQAKPAPAPGVEVVGAYESGGAKYTMYSDGSVIAEAEGQTMFFKSLEELREFIDGGAKT